MIEFRRKLFSEKEKKISSLDKINLKLAKIGTQEGKEVRRDYLKKLSKGKVDEGLDIMDKHQTKRQLQLGAVGTAAMGGLGALAASGLKHHKKDIILTSVAVPVGLTTLGVGGVKLSKNLSRPLLKKAVKDKDTRKQYEKNSDYYNVAAGDMTRKQFKNKWGK